LIWGEKQQKASNQISQSAEKRITLT